MPFLVGFISKWILCLGALQAGKPLYVLLWVASGLLAAAYLIPVSQMAFFVKDPQEKFRSYGEISYAMLIPICITTLIALILGCVPNIYPHFYELATMASNAVCAGWHGGWL